MATNVSVSIEVQDKNNAASAPQDDNCKKNLRKRKPAKDEKTSRKPPESRWLQQQMPACRPVFTAKHTFFLFITIGLIFIGLGILFLVTSINLKEISIDYGNSMCKVQNADDLASWLNNNSTSSVLLQNVTVCKIVSYQSCEGYLNCVAQLPNVFRADAPTCKCIINVTVPSPMKLPVYFYYGLDNFFQNHRRYLNSWNPDQLRGSINAAGSSCAPLDSRRPINRTDGGLEATPLPVAPCGLIANSFFNDSFAFNSSSGLTLDETNIAWQTDLKTRFSNPGSSKNITAAQLNGTTMPPSWPRDLSYLPNGLENEHLIVWFRVSAFWKFKKLYGRLYANNSTVLPSGIYSLNVEYNFPVSGYKGAKYIVLSEVSWLGGKNNFLGIAYIVTGILAAIAGFVLLAVHLTCSKLKATSQTRI